jgi:hypothetical protein
MCPTAVYLYSRKGVGERVHEAALTVGTEFVELQRGFSLSEFRALVFRPAWDSSMYAYMYTYRYITIYIHIYHYIYIYILITHTHKHTNTHTHTHMHASCPSSFCRFHPDISGCRCKCIEIRFENLKEIGVLLSRRLSLRLSTRSDQCLVVPFRFENTNQK